MLLLDEGVVLLVGIEFCGVYFVLYVWGGVYGFYVGVINLYFEWVFGLNCVGLYF